MKLNAIKLVQVASEHLEDYREVEVHIRIGNQVVICDPNKDDFEFSSLRKALRIDVSLDLDEIKIVGELQNEIAKLEEELDKLREANQQLETEVETLKDELKDLTNNE